MNSFGEKHGHEKLDKLEAVEGEQDLIIPEELNEEDNID
jgi:hypothetical protein